MLAKCLAPIFDVLGHIDVFPFYIRAKLSNYSCHCGGWGGTVLVYNLLKYIVCVDKFFVNESTVKKKGSEA